MEALEQPGTVSFTVFGEPVSKGNKSAFAIRKGGVLTGKVAVVEGKNKRLPEWTARVHAAAQAAARDGAPLLEGPLSMAAHFRMTRPKSAPKRRRVWPAKRPDLDKLLRGVLDPLTGILFVDDAQIVSLVASKDYVADGEQPGVTVMLWPLLTSDPWAHSQQIPPGGSHDHTRSSMS